MMLFILASLLSFYSKNVAEPRYDEKDDQFADASHASQSHASHTPLNLRIHLVFWCFLLNRHFGTLTCLNPITNQTMTNLQNIVTRLRIIVLSYSYSAYHQNDTLKVLP